MSQLAKRTTPISALPNASTENAAPAPDPRPDEGWLVLVTSGPNQGAVVPLGCGTFSFGSGLSNDIVLADPAMAEAQAELTFDASGARIALLAPGLSIDAKSVHPGRRIAVTDGTLIHAGETVLQLRGPPPPRRPWGWLLLAVPLLLAGIGGAALVGVASPSRESGTPHPAATATPAASQALNAMAALRERLQQAGLDEQITLAASPGAVVASGSLSGPDLARWSEHQLWFDGRYKGALSLVNQVREAAPSERPNLQLRAVSTGQVPYLVVANGDRLVEGTVVDGWTIDQISPDKVVLSRNGRRVELAL